ncbi:hypothetical protein F0562_010749 [Nyssa sinensis]|uniref:TCP domain-containing protein n=1 Tax=Nyssa sinensis TaxID=561372 RepID=A0A5J5A2N0_9ASTE|nr:hypothetical protein F0562_010749 [Nyssa sinensis]
MGPVNSEDGRRSGAVAIPEIITLHCGNRVDVRFGLLRGHILQSTGQKDRHSKVYTVKGLRDRRVWLSPPTTIQFYDVQDRLGYDRPSKVVDWLIKKAKNAIDKLAELPPWNPNDSTMAPSADPNYVVLEHQ